MNTTNTLLAEVKRAAGLVSWGAVQRHLEVSPQTMRNYRHNRTDMDDAVALRACAMLGKTREQTVATLAALAADRASGSPSAAYWKEAASTLARRAAVVAVFMFAWLFGGPGDHSGAKVSGLNIIFLGTLARRRIYKNLNTHCATLARAWHRVTVKISRLFNVGISPLACT